MNDFPNPGESSSPSIEYSYVQVFENTSLGATFTTHLDGYVIAYPIEDADSIYIEANAFS